MHFFNPPPLMQLLEVIRADQTGERGARAGARGRRGDGQARDRRGRRPGLPRQPLRAPVRRRGAAPARERVATHEQIDRICRLGGGFRMGPFELMDLVGIDVGFEVAKSFDELSFGEPRWRPSPIQARMVAAGRLGPQDRARLLRVRRGRAPTARTIPSRPRPAAATARS